MTTTCDVAIIGAGPAGLAASMLTTEHGLSTVVLDEQSGPGGQIYRGVETAMSANRRVALGSNYRRGAGLVEAFHGSGAQYRPGMQVCQVESDNILFASDGVRLHRFAFRKLIVAVGALERPVPVPGWTLPGVMGVGAAQILFKTAGLLPDEGVWVAGCGPLPLLYISQILRAGGRVAGFLDTAMLENRRAAVRHMPRALAAWKDLLKGLDFLATLRRGGIRHVRRGVDQVSVLGRGRVEGIRFRCGTEWHEIPAAGVLLHEGVVPNIHVTLALRCRHVWDEHQLCFRPVLDEWFRTDVADVLVAGDSGGIGGAGAAEARGELAGLAAALDLGRIPIAEAKRRAAPMRRALARHLAIRPLLDALYRPRAAVLAPEDAVVVCRCEGITAGEVRAAVAAGCDGPDAVKSLTRCGMGPCQGRECGLTLTGTIAAARGVPPDDIGFFRIRPPLKQLKIGELAGLLQAEREPAEPVP